MNTKRIALIIILLLVIVVVAFSFVSANTHNTKIDVVSNSTLKNGESVVIQLSDDYRNKLADQKVDVKILADNGWAHKYNVTTDQNGEGSITLETFENGNYTVRCNYNGTMFFRETSSQTPLNIDDGLG